jgi:hypothetical protein
MNLWLIAHEGSSTAVAFGAYTRNVAPFAMRFTKLRIHRQFRLYRFDGLGTIPKYGVSRCILAADLIGLFYGSHKFSQVLHWHNRDCSLWEVHPVWRLDPLMLRTPKATKLKPTQ